MGRRASDAPKRQGIGLGAIFPIFEVEKEKKNVSNQSGIPNNSELAEDSGGSLTMPNAAKQFERHSWAAGYADGFIDGLEEAWARIKAEIERRPTLQRGKDERRNGLLLACELIASPKR